jgi:hypothetical protein
MNDIQKTGPGCTVKRLKTAPDKAREGEELAQCEVCWGRDGGALETHWERHQARGGVGEFPRELGLG